MKKLLLLLIMAVSLPVAAQFKATKNGFVAEDGKSFCVFPIEGKTAMDLYKGVNACILSNFQNPDVVASKEEGEIINMHIYSDHAFDVSIGMGLKVGARIDMNLIVYFREGRMRIDAPVINSMAAPRNAVLDDKMVNYYFSGGVGKFVGSASLFKDDGEVKDKKFVASLENYVNAIVAGIVEYAKNYTEEEW